MDLTPHTRCDIGETMNKKSFQFKRLVPSDLGAFKSLVGMFNTVFEEEQNIGSDTHLLKLLGNNSFIAIAALSENEVTGGLTAYELPMIYSDESEVILYDMAVKEEYQRMGIGKGLIQSLKEYCVKNEIETFFVMAHEEDIHAVEFYHATGGKSEKVINFLYDLNK
jgi:aminoglycoside 3-N-acetyltransferase I